MDIQIHPASADRFDDLQHALTGGGDGASCQCAWLTLTNTEFSATTRDDRERMLRDETELPLPPGLIAYVAGEPAAWVRVGPRRTHRRLPRTRALAPHLAEPWDSDDVWTISCFVVRREHRGVGLNTELLAAAVDFAKQHDAALIEAYPVDPEGAHARDNDLWHGVLSTFLAAGFTETARAQPKRPVVRLTLR